MAIMCQSTIVQTLIKYNYLISHFVTSSMTFAMQPVWHLIYCKSSKPARMYLQYSDGSVVGPYCNIRTLLFTSIRKCKKIICVEFHARGRSIM
jgi:hypothetical protein